MGFKKVFTSFFAIEKINWRKSSDNFMQVSIMVIAMSIISILIPQIENEDVIDVNFLSLFNLIALLLGGIWMYTAIQLKKGKVEALPFARYLPLLTVLVLLVLYPFLNIVPDDFDYFLWIIYGGYGIYFLVIALKCLWQYTLPQIDETYVLDYKKEYLFSLLHMSVGNSSLLLFFLGFGFIIIISNRAEEIPYLVLLIPLTIVGIIFGTFFYNRRRAFFKSNEKVKLSVVPRNHGQNAFLPFRFLIQETGIEARSGLNACWIPYGKNLPLVINSAKCSIRFPDSFSHLIEETEFVFSNSDFMKLYSYLSKNKDCECDICGNIVSIAEEPLNPTLVKKEKKRLVVIAIIVTIPLLLSCILVVLIRLNYTKNLSLKKMDKQAFDSTLASTSIIQDTPNFIVDYSEYSYVHENVFPNSGENDGDSMNNRIMMNFGPAYNSQSSEAPEHFRNVNVWIRDNVIESEQFTTSIFSYVNLIYEDRAIRREWKNLIILSLVFIVLTQFIMSCIFHIYRQNGKLCLTLKEELTTRTLYILTYTFLIGISLLILHLQFLFCIT